MTLALALLGAVLGVLNTIHALWRDRVRLRVKRIYEVGETGIRRTGIEVINLSAFDVGIGSVFIAGPGKEKALLEIADALPKKIAPRASAAIWFVPGALDDPKLPRSGRVTVVTLCEVKAYSNFTALRS